jgi:hypothetical protein
LPGDETDWKLETGLGRLPHFGVEAPGAIEPCLAEHGNVRVGPGDKTCKRIAQHVRPEQIAIRVWRPKPVKMRQPDCGKQQRIRPPRRRCGEGVGQCSSVDLFQPVRELACFRPTCFDEPVEYLQQGGQAFGIDLKYLAMIGECALDEFYDNTDR